MGYLGVGLTAPGGQTRGAYLTILSHRYLCK